MVSELLNALCAEILGRRNVTLVSEKVEQNALHVGVLEKRNVSHVQVMDIKPVLHVEELDGIHFWICNVDHAMEVAKIDVSLAVAPAMKDATCVGAKDTMNV